MKEIFDKKEGEQLKIKGKISVELVEDVFTFLELKVKFKLHNDFFSKSAKTTLRFYNSVNYESKKDFYDNCIRTLKDKGYIKMKAKEVIESYIEERIYESNKSDSKNGLNNTLKMLNKEKLTIEVEI